MPRQNHRRERPQATKRIRLQVVSRSEEDIDRRQLSLALLALERDLRGRQAARCDKSYARKPRVSESELTQQEANDG